MIGIATVKSKVSIFEIAKIAVILITASLAFGAAFQQIDSNKQDLKSLHAYYKDVSYSLSTISNSVSRMEGKIELIVKKVY